MYRWLNALGNFARRALARLAGRRAAGNVADLSRHRRRRRLRQLAGADADHPAGLAAARCSRCRKTAGRLTFYADETGRPIGLCKTCEPHAKRRGLLPL